MTKTIAYLGIGSLVGLLLSSVAVLLAVIWDADFAVKVGCTAMVGSAAIFVAALVATNSPLYKD